MTVDDEERIVDPDPEADERREFRSNARDAHSVRQQQDHEGRDTDSGDAGDDWQQGSPHGAEHQQQDQQGSKDADHVAGTSAANLCERRVPVSTLSWALLASLARVSASPACLVELKIDGCVCGVSVLTDLVSASGGKRADDLHDPGTWATLSNIGMILDRAEEETAAPLVECQTMMPGVADAALFPAFARRAYAVAESDAGSRSELLNAVPATPRTPPSTTSKAIHPPIMALRLRVQN